MISHAVSQEKKRQTDSLNVFSGPMINHAISQEAQTDSLSGCVFRSHDQSWQLLRK